MAHKATIFKAHLQIADMDRHYFHDHALTLARHPSETDERMMVRLLAFARHASENLMFTRGLSTSDEPDLWEKDLTGDIITWIELGQPDERRIRKACGQADQVFIYAYSGRGADIWWEQIREGIAGLRNLTVLNLPAGSARELAGLAQRNMQLQCTIQDGLLWLGNTDTTVEASLAVWQ
jgi:uncharacterized protein YaeQ